MKEQKIFSFLKWNCTYLVVFTIAFSPIAQSYETEKKSIDRIKYQIKYFNLDKKTTLGQFWEKSRPYVPGHVYADLESFVKENKNRVMPRIFFNALKDTNGNFVPVLKLEKDGKISTIQIFQEKNKWAKFNGITITEADFERVDDVFKRLIASDINLKKESDQYIQSRKSRINFTRDQKIRNTYKVDFSRFNGFPRLTPQLWKSLSKQQRAEYIIKMRMMWMSAVKINSLQGSSTNEKNYSALDLKNHVSFENFVELLFNKSHAADIKKAKITPSARVQVAGATVRTKQGKVVSIPYDAKSCVVAGYIGAYGKVSNISGDNRDGCSIDLAIATYKSNPNLEFIQKANEECASDKSTQVACNPIIYGYPSGKPACIDRRSAEYQQATHFTSDSKNQTCDGKSRLSSSDEIIRFNEKDYSSIQPREKQIAAIEEDQKKNDYELTKSFITGVLTQKDPIMVALLEKGEWNLALDEELVRIQTQFEQEIERAIKSCESDISSKHEKNQKLACDQLHRRWLFTERFIAQLRDKACIKPSLYIGSYSAQELSTSHSAKDKNLINKKTIDEKGTNLCACPDSSKKISFGESCSLVADTESGTEKPVKCDKPDGISDFDYASCKCSSGVELILKSGDDGGYQCGDEKTESIKIEEKDYTPWLLAGGGILAAIVLYNAFKKKDPPIQATCQKTCASDTSLNATTCTCDVIPPAQSCIPPKEGTYPSCNCPVAQSSTCVAPQKIYDYTTCQCQDVPQPVICADGSSAPSGNSSLCPKCNDGSFRTQAGCPASNEGGTGNNCPQGGCSGGLPGTGN